MWHCGLGLALGLAVSGCDKPSGATIVTSPYANGEEQKEPIIYNGKRYEVSFRFQAAGNLYDVEVTAERRKLGGTEGDRRVVEQVAMSAVRHFACPTGQRSQVVSGSARHGGSGWGMQVRCA